MGGILEDDWWSNEVGREVGRIWKELLGIGGRDQYSEYIVLKHSNSLKKEKYKCKNKNPVNNFESYQNPSLELLKVDYLKIELGYV